MNSTRYPIPSESHTRLYITDCEGPISTNDNAFELTSHFIPQGNKFFAKVSRYDDVLADIVKRPEYKAGNTLKLILPFLQAYGATDNSIIAFSRSNIMLVPGAKKTLRFLQEIMPSYIISTSYRYYIKAVSEMIGFPLGNTYSTDVEIDRYSLSTEEEKTLKKFLREIESMPMLSLSSNTYDGLHVEDKRVLEKLDEIFFDKIPAMRCGRILEDVNPIGGEEKAKAVKEIVSVNNCALDDVIYIGDSITDTASLKLVREAGGIAVSFNGNEYAIREAEIVVISGTSYPVSALAYLFKRGGTDQVLQSVSSWKYNELQEHLPSQLMKVLKSESSDIPIDVTILTEKNKIELIEKSSSTRNLVRGEAAASLG
jgi:energy-converting hydrogenase A subunit R